MPPTPEIRSIRSPGRGLHVAEPSNTEIINALRLGWCLAEVKGRNRPDPPGVADRADRPLDLLPLRIERSNPESRLEAQAVLHALAKLLAVDDDTRGTVKSSFSADIEKRAHELADFRNKQQTDEARTQWTLLVKDVYHFDAHIQDSLASTSELLACAYQLGRGLSESYWASEPSSDAPSAETIAAWKSLLGPQRCAELSRLVGRIGPALHDYTPSAIAGSLAIWKEVVATDDWWQQERTSDDLAEQQRRWYELLVLGQDPTSLIRPFALLRSFRTTGKAIRLFLPQLAGLTVSIAFLVAFAAVSGTGVGKAVVGAVGVVGLSLTAMQTWIKNTAQAMTKRLHQDAYSDLLALEVTVAPPRKPDGFTYHPISDPTDRARASALRDRTLTTADSVAA
jgi:hypothetical protein